MALKLKRDHLLSAERETIKLIAASYDARGTPLERFSRGTFKVFEAMGLGVEKLLTGRTTERSPLPPPDSVRRLRETTSADQLAELHCERLRVEDQLKATLVEHGLVVTAGDIRATLESVEQKDSL
jgi:hypothetical protein